MAIENVKKVIIKRENLPSFSAENNTYSVRYRVVSQDKNRFSHWSPHHYVSRGLSPNVLCSVTVLTGVVNMVWKQPEGYNIKEFDIYFKIDDGDFEYISSASSTQFSTLIDESASSITVAIQLPTYPKKYSTDAAIFTSDIILL
jgi:hypothetical protein